jgi:hypothetical protein
LNRDQFDPTLEFIHELDNVVPQNLRGMMLWLEQRIANMPTDERRVLEDALSAALRESARELRSLMKQHGTNALVRRAIAVLVRKPWLTRVSWLRRFAKVPAIEFDDAAAIAARIGKIQPLSSARARGIDLYVAGHTHAALRRAFMMEQDRQITHVNTGTWRRTHVPARGVQEIAFETFYEETLLCVHPLSTRAQTGRYDFHRYVRGE